MGGSYWIDVCCMDANYKVKTCRVIVSEPQVSAADVLSLLSMQVEFDVKRCAITSYGKRISLFTQIQSESRIELSQPLAKDPMQQRRNRIKNSRNTG